MSDERRARPGTAPQNHVSVRLDAATIARVEAVAPLFSTEWRTATRSDVLRGLILDALDRMERGGRPQTGRREKAGARKAKRGGKAKRG